MQAGPLSLCGRISFVASVPHADGGDPGSGFTPDYSASARVSSVPGSAVQAGLLSLCGRISFVASAPHADGGDPGSGFAPDYSASARVSSVPGSGYKRDC